MNRENINKALNITAQQIYQLEDIQSILFVVGNKNGSSRCMFNDELDARAIAGIFRTLSVTGRHDIIEDALRLIEREIEFECGQVSALSQAINIINGRGDV